MGDAATSRTREPAAPGGRLPDRLVASPWVWRLAVLGFVAKGLLYLVAGATAALALAKVSGRVRGTRGALELLASSPFGRLAALFVAVGLLGYILRRVVQVLVPPDEGKPPRTRFTRAMRRVGFALSGLAHVGIAMAALGLTLGLTAPSSQARRPAPDWTALLVEWNPLDGWLAVFAGLVAVGVGVFHVSVAVRRRFAVDLHVDRMEDRVKRAAFAFGVAGYAGRAVAFLLLGAFLVYAGWYVDEVEARGFGDVIRSLETQSSGTWLLAAIAVGLIAYGCYLLLTAWYVRLIATW